MPKAASLKNLRPWKPGQSGNPNGRPRAPRFTERDQHVIRSIGGADGWNGVTWSALDEANADAVIAAQISRFAELSRP